MLVKVWNDHSKDYSEKYDDKIYLIKAKNFIELDEDEARELVRRWSPIIKDGAGNDANPKMLRMEYDPYLYAKKMGQPIDDEDKPVFTCMACNKTFESQKGLDTHIKIKHKELIIDEKGREALKNV